MGIGPYDLSKAMVDAIESSVTSSAHVMVCNATTGKALVKRGLAVAVAHGAFALSFDGEAECKRLLALAADQAQRNADADAKLAADLAKITNHEASSHSRRSAECRICGNPVVDHLEVNISESMSVAVWTGNVYGSMPDPVRVARVAQRRADLDRVKVAPAEVTPEPEAEPGRPLCSVCGMRYVRRGDDRGKCTLCLLDERAPLIDTVTEVTPGPDDTMIYEAFDTWGLDGFTCSEECMRAYIGQEVSDWYQDTFWREHVRRVPHVPLIMEGGARFTFFDHCMTCRKPLPREEELVADDVATLPTATEYVDAVKGAFRAPGGKRKGTRAEARRNGGKRVRR